MKKRDQGLGLLICILAALCLIPGSTDAQVKKSKPKTGAQPNIILILTDDLDWQSMAYLDRMKALMADQGTTFNQYFTPNAMCCPSRASTLTGQYSHNTDVFGNGYPHGGYQTFFEKGLENQTVATALQEAGYRTALIGKYLNGYPNVGQETHVPPGWDEWAVRLDHDASYDDDGPGTFHVKQLQTNTRQRQ